MQARQTADQSETRLGCVCPLCVSSRVEPFHSDNRREYRRCRTCDLVFVPPGEFLSRDAERACYDLHENSPDDQRYRAFLARLAEPLQSRLPPGARGLDFGSGPGPTLSVMLTEAGFPTRIYDPYYAPDRDVFRETYDFVTASETIEHLHRPRFELDRLWSLLRLGGWLGIMTKRWISQEAFASWHYKQDPTHVIFFSEGTFRWLAKRWNARLDVISDDVLLLQKLE